MWWLSSVNGGVAEAPTYVPLEDRFCARIVMFFALSHCHVLCVVHSCVQVLLGKAIQGKRAQYTIATKCGIVFKDGQMGFDGSRKHVREACEASLGRLGIDCIDLYYLHRQVAVRRERLADLSRPHVARI